MISNKEMEKLVARTIYHQAFKLDKRLIDDFLNGFFSSLKEDSTPWTEELLPVLDKAEKNLKETLSHFRKLKSQNSSIEIKKGSLYSEILEFGKGQILIKPSTVIISYSIRDLYDKILVNKENHSVKITDLIPGFYLGIQGMLERERRRLHIHPSWGYGVFRSEIPCSTLIVDVTLEKILDETSTDWPNPIPLNLCWIENPLHLSEMREGVRRSARLRGYHYRALIEKHTTIDTASVIQILKNYQKLNAISPLTESEMERLVHGYGQYLKKEKA